MLRTRRTFPVAAVAAIFAAACSDQDLTTPAALDQVSTSQGQIVECQVLPISGEHGSSPLTSVSAFGLDFDVWAKRWRGSTQANWQIKDYNAAQVWNTDSADDVPEDGRDLRWQGPNARCSTCQGQGNIFTIASHRGFPTEADAHGGGWIEIGGFGGAPAGYSFAVRSWAAVDNDSNEGNMLLVVDDNLFATSRSTGAGDGVVEQISLDPVVPISNRIRFVLGRPNWYSPGPEDPFSSRNGSGGVGSVEVCLVQQNGGGGDAGCTPGYWKNHPHRWPGSIHSELADYSPATTIAMVFGSLPANLRDLNGNGVEDSLLDALDYGGGPGVAGGARILLRAAVAAVLSAAHPDVNYPRTLQSVINDVNAALASGNRNTMIALGEALDSDNNRSCPLQGGPAR